MSAEIMHGDCLTVLPTLASGSVQTCVTSPPYWGLRDYGVDGQLGLEKTPEEYVAKMVETFREVRRVLRDDGTLWLNLGDSYAGSNASQGGDGSSATYADGRGTLSGAIARQAQRTAQSTPTKRGAGLKPKDLVGIPWRVAFALQADGWYLRSDIIWHKPNPMPESVTDRPTKAHEYLFLLTKSPTYFYDADAVREPASMATLVRWRGAPRRTGEPGSAPDRNDYDGSGGETTCGVHPLGRNRRSVWTVATRPYKGAHFATFPPALIEPCILAGSKPGDTVLDPFGGSGTTAAVATRHNRNAISIELNAAYLPLQYERLAKEQPALGIA